MKFSNFFSKCIFLSAIHLKAENKGGVLFHDKNSSLCAQVYVCVWGECEGARLGVRESV